MAISDTQILWGSDKIMIIDHTPQSKVDDALKVVEECVSGERGFCFRLVKKYPLDSGREIREQIVLLKRERMNPATVKSRGDVITSKLKVLRTKEREHYSYDLRAYRTLRANYDRLKRSLELLHREGYVYCYTLTGNGYLSISWFTSNEHIELQEIDQGWSYTYEHTGFQARSHVSDMMWSVYNMTPAVREECIPTVDPNHYKKQGKVDKQWEGFGKNAGNGEYDGDICVSPFKSHCEPTPAEAHDIRQFNPEVKTNDYTNSDVPRFT